MTETQLQSLPKSSIRNRTAVEESECCGCYNCLAVFSAREVMSWTDGRQTALCPHCGVDSVLAQTTGIALDDGELRQARRYWMGN